MRDNWKKIVFNKLGGLEGFMDESLVTGDSLSAIDICNFRMEKVGKLVTRDGYLFGLYLHSDKKNYGKVAEDENGRPISMLYDNVWRYIKNAGIIGMAEYTLSDYWEAIDTDTLMVYAINGEEIIERGLVPTIKYVMTFLFSPISGKYKDQLLVPAENTEDGHEYGDFIFYANKLLDIPQLVHEDKHAVVIYPLKGRKRNINVTPDKWDEWIEQFIDMEQYQDKLYISDRINGDMVLEDEYDINPEMKRQKKHRLILRRSGLYVFDIDTVKFDWRREVGQENYEVVAPMGLYKYTARKNTFKKPIGGFEELPIYDKCDSYESAITSHNDFMSKKCHGICLYSSLIARINPWQKSIYLPNAFPNSNTIIKGIYLSGRYNNKDRMLFTNADTPGDVYDDLLQPVELAKDEVKDENGNVIKERIADIYRWDDFKIPYRIVKLLDANDVFLTENTKYYEKTTKGTKLERITIKDLYGRDVPLGIYKYRFVWDFGNGNYSAPSAEAVIPDTVWSALWDDTIYYSDKYKLPINHEDIKLPYWENNTRKFYDGITFSTSAMPQVGQKTQAYYEGPKLYGSRIKGGGSLKQVYFLSDIGKLYHKLKKELYNNTYCKYGMVVDESEYEADEDELLNNTNGVADRWGELICCLTTKFPKEVETRGNFAAIYGAFKGYKYDEMKSFHIDYGKDIVIPRDFFFEEPKKYSYPPLSPYMPGYITLDESTGIFHKIIGHNILFEMYYNNNDLRDILPIIDEDGKYLILGKDPHPSLVPYLIVPLWIKSGYLIVDGDHRIIDVFAHVVDANNNSTWETYMPIVGTCSPEGDYQHLRLRYYKIDPRITPNDPYYDYYYPRTLVRNAFSETDMLYNISYKVPQEVIDRLVLRGAIGFNIMKYGDEYRLTNVAIKKGVWEGKNYVSFDTSIYRKWEWNNTNTEYKWANNLYFLAGRYLSDYALIPIPGPPFISYETYMANDMPLFHMFNYDNGGVSDVKLNNIDVILYAEAARFLGIEQLTSYFPGSGLFQAPRIGITIKREDIPKRAKRLLIFRTLSSLQNDYQYNKFGLVKAVEVPGDINKDLYFFDDVKDGDLDFSYNILDYYGISNKIYSRFCYALNERLWKYNFKEEYQPISPRGKADDVTINYVIVEPKQEVDDGRALPGGTYEYAFVYVDKSGINSKRKRVTIIVPANKVVVFYVLPEEYDDSLDKLEIYRRDKFTEEKLCYIGEITRKDGHIFADNNKPRDEKKNLNDDVMVYDYDGGLRWSEPYNGDMFKQDAFVDYNSGDGTQGTGMACLSGDLILFKENSIRRYTVQGADNPITRTDDITTDIGCIAPLSLLNINNLIFFLSRKGFMLFDNNIPSNIDQLFNEELLFRMSGMESYVKYISAGFNYYRNEIYINVPYLIEPYSDKKELYDWKSKRHLYEKTDKDKKIIGMEREIWGHIYVINLEKKYVTKYSYQPTVAKKYSYQFPSPGSVEMGKKVIHPLGNVRMYYNDKKGNMRSADIVPNIYYYMNTQSKQRDFD